MQQTEYVIEGLVRFSPAQGRLCLVESSETSVPLSPACNHLLEMFLKSPGVVLAREHILDNFWQETGATPSFNSLNAYVSSIRRGFASLGISQDVITTVYKVGFVFNPTLAIQTTHLEPELAAPTADLVSPTAALPRRDRRYYAAGIAVLLLAGMTVLMLSSLRPEKSIAPVSVADVNGCEVLYLPVHPGESAFPPEPVWRKIIASSGMPCQKGGKYLFYADRNVTAGHWGNVYVAYCRHVTGGQAYCSNYSELGWRAENE
ncbi:transcriptional regulator [Pantoea stewartii]|uniref:winged helix-turn-helix domain-containing protein n=1 Tax=Pantoea stewartii TaxID=66269 RepID=UPI00345C5B7D